MAVQAHGRKPGAQILRTPAPDELSTIRSPRGGAAYGQNSPIGNPSSIPPGQGGPQSLLGKNLRESVDDPAADMVLAHGVAGRGDSIPADDDYNDAGGQLRLVSDKLYPVAAGGSMVRQQDPEKVFGKAKPSLPSNESNSQAQPVRKPS